MSETVTIRGADGAEFFYTLDRILEGLITALAAGRVDEAVDLYSRCREDIGFQLISRVQGKGEVFRQVANMFFRARDFQRAAYCCEHLEEPAKAAALYEQADDPAAAAQMYAAAGSPLKAAEMFAKAGNNLEAARLYQHSGEHLRAALCFEKARRPFDAAQAYEKAGRPEKAVELFQAVDDDSPDKKMAGKLAKELLERSSLQRAHTGQIAAVAVSAAGAVVPAAPIAVGGGELDDEGKNRVTMMEGFDFLHRLPLFAELSLPELKGLYHLCDVVPFSFGDKLVDAKGPAPALFILLEGVVDVRGGKHGAAIARLGAGSHVGEMSLFDDAPAGVDVVAAAPGRALRLNRQGFAEVLRTSDSLGVRVYRVLFRTVAERLRETTRRLEAAGVAPAVPAAIAGLPDLKAPPQ
jgi:tetratricopeptide (TPR) repeat protein